MGIVKIEQYGSNGRLKMGLDCWAVYAAFANPRGEKGLVKVGMTTRPLRRIHEVHCGSPYGIEVALWSLVGAKRQALSVERTIHNRLADKKTRGEWFEFDFADPADKELFHAVTKAAYARATGKPLKWSRVSMAQVRESLGVDWAKIPA